ncbi:deoxyribose-phosphate aldolase [Flammeovirgaceae bacterium SG7u.111]|nr:deoxyribose-phosphate aldolase [Flammeovirgaceae bacterium SG7u.132]WPO36111.1 deoxyribose-phosphate aldolase [Flammeovirgaceae bacterium SG7u.111]
MEKINTYIEHTLLSPEISSKKVETLAKEAITHGFHGICIPPYWVKKAKREVEGSEVKIVTVIGFPLGYQITSVKVAEIQKAIADGAGEIDMVLNLGAFRENPAGWAKPDVAACAKACHEAEVPLKVILETAYLSDEEIKAACFLCKEAGADFVKTSTGFAPAGAKAEHIKLMRESVGEQLGIKASGGVKTLSDALAMIEAGADRIGTSSGVAIVKEAN